MSDCYESMSRTPIRDRPLRQPLIRHSRHPFVNPAPHSSFRRRPESRGVGRGDGSAVEDFARRGACPPPTADRRSTGGAIFILLRGRANAMVIPAKACPGLRYGSGIQGRRGQRDRSRNPKTLRIMQRWGLSPAHGAPAGVRPLSSSAGTSPTFTSLPPPRCSGALMNLLAILSPWTGYAVAGLAIMSNAQRSANQPWRAN